MTLLDKLKNQILDLPDDVKQKSIDSTADALLGMNFSPQLLLKTENFLYMKKSDIQDEFNRIIALSNDEIKAEGFENSEDVEKIKLDHLKLLLYNYKLLCRLRNNEPEAWDQINELYEDD